jgi:hypothetical protein
MASIDPPLMTLVMLQWVHQTAIQHMLFRWTEDPHKERISLFSEPEQ